MPGVRAPKTTAATFACMQSRWDAARFRDLLDQFAAQTGLSQRAIARLAGFAESQVSRWRSGDHQPAYATLRKLTDAIALEYPAHTSLAADLFTAAGYGQMPEPGPLPPLLVRDNWADQVVRDVWAQDVIPAESRLGIVTHYLSERDRAQTDPPAEEAI